MDSAVRLLSEWSTRSRSDVKVIKVKKVSARKSPILLVIPLAAAARPPGDRLPLRARRRKPRDGRRPLLRRLRRGRRYLSLGRVVLDGLRRRAGHLGRRGQRGARARRDADRRVDLLLD